MPGHGNARTAGRPPRRLASSTVGTRTIGLVLAGVSKQGIPWVSTLIAFVVGIICFLPFPSWQSLVTLVTSATVIMYGFAPLTLAALRRVDPDRPRPYRLPAVNVIAPLGFIAANLIIYWSSFPTVWKLGIAIAIGYALFVAFRISTRLRHGTSLVSEDLQLRQLTWILPWLLGIGVVSWLGQYDGTKTIPEWIDLAVIAAWSIVIYVIAVRMAMPRELLAAQVRVEEAEVEAAVES